MTIADCPPHCLNNGHASGDYADPNPCGFCPRDPQPVPKWYVTFPQRLASRNNYFVIEAATERAAHDQAMRLFGTEWAFLYDEESFAGQPEEYGLTEIKR